MLKIYGIERSEFRGLREDWQARLHPDDVERILTTERSALAETTPQSLAIEHRIFRPDGAVRHIFSNLYVQTNEQGQAFRTIGINMDVTHQVEAQEALQKSQEQFRRITENVPGMIFRYVRHSDNSDPLVYVSALVRDMYEVEPEEALADASSFLSSIHPNDADRIQRAMQLSAEQLSPFCEEFRVVLPNQGLRWRQSVSQPWRNEAGDTVWDGVTIDITHRKTAEIQLQRANEDE